MVLFHSLVHCISVEIVQILNSNLEVGTPLALVNGVVKQIDVGVQRELVHRIDKIDHALRVLQVNIMACSIY